MVKKEEYVYCRIKKENLAKLGYALFVVVIIVSIFMIGYVCGKGDGWNNLHEEIFSKESFSMIVGNCYTGCSTSSFIRTTEEPLNWKDAIEKR